MKTKTTLMKGKNKETNNNKRNVCDFKRAGWLSCRMSSVGAASWCACVPPRAGRYRRQSDSSLCRTQALADTRIRARKPVMEFSDAEQVRLSLALAVEVEPCL